MFEGVRPNTQMHQGKRSESVSLTKLFHQPTRFIYNNQVKIPSDHFVVLIEVPVSSPGFFVSTRLESFQCCCSGCVSVLRRQLNSALSFWDFVWTLMTLVEIEWSV